MYIFALIFLYSVLNIAYWTICMGIHPGTQTDMLISAISDTL